MKTVPFTRQEMIDCIEGRPTRRPAVAIGTWIHLDQLSEDKQRRLEKLYADYPFDMEAFYIKKPATFGQPGDRFCWCDVKDADPHIGRTKSVGVDEENAISWEVYDQITPELPDPVGVDLFEGWPEDDGRYRMAWLSYGPWSRIWEYRGMTNSLTDLYTDPARVQSINDRTMRWFKEVIDQVAAGHRADAIGFGDDHGMQKGPFMSHPARVQSINDRTMRWFKEVIDQVAAGHRADAIGFGDDHGMQKGPFMSPKMFRKFYFPFYKELCDYAHSRGLHVWLHCCGDAMKLLDQFILAGFDVLHPIQKYAMDETAVMEKYGGKIAFWSGMDLQQILPFGSQEDVRQEVHLHPIQKYAMDETAVMEKYGGKIAFWSGMDLQQILPFGSQEDVRQEVHHLVDTFYAPQKTRTIFTVSNRLEDNVPVENIEAFIQEVYAYTEGPTPAAADAGCTGA